MSTHSDLRFGAIACSSVIHFREGLVDSGDGGRLEAAMRDEIGRMYPGLDLQGPDMPKAGPDQLNPPNGVFLVGYEDELAICCGGIKRLDSEACELKRMYVIPGARGRGVGRILLGALEDRARDLGYAVARLDTGPDQLGARRLYESEGYVAIPNFNRNPMATFFGEKRLN